MVGVGTFGKQGGCSFLPSFFTHEDSTPLLRLLGYKYRPRSLDATQIPGLTPGAEIRKQCRRTDRRSKHLEKTFRIADKPLPIIDAQPGKYLACPFPFLPYP